MFKGNWGRFVATLRKEKLPDLPFLGSLSDPIALEDPFPCPLLLVCFQDKGVE